MVQPATKWLTSNSETETTRPRPPPTRSNLALALTLGRLPPALCCADPRGTRDAIGPQAAETHRGPPRGVVVAAEGAQSRVVPGDEVGGRFGRGFPKLGGRK